MEYEVKATYVGRPDPGQKAKKIEPLEPFTVTESSKDRCLKRAKARLMENGYYVRSVNFAVDHGKPPSSSTYIQVVVTDAHEKGAKKDIHQARLDKLHSELGD